MLTCSAALRRNCKSLGSHGIYEQQIRHASLLSSIKRGIRGESADVPRGSAEGPPHSDGAALHNGRKKSIVRLGGRRPGLPAFERTPRNKPIAGFGIKAHQRRPDYDPSRGRWDVLPKDHDSSQRNGHELRKSFDGSRKSSERSSRSDGDEPRQSYDRFSVRSEDRPPRKSFDRPPRSNHDEPRKSFDRSPRSYDDKPQRSFDRFSSGSEDISSRKSFDRSPRSYDDKPRRSFDKFSSIVHDKPRRSFNRVPNGRSDGNDNPRRSFDRSPRSTENEPRKPLDRPATRSFERNQDRNPRASFSSDKGDGEPTSLHVYPEKAFGMDNGHISIPYTTAASEFLYGSNVVYAALKSRRRNLYNLYLPKRAEGGVPKAGDLETLAKRAGVKINRVQDDFKPVLDKMANNRPHNGVILEASPLPIPPVEQLSTVDALSKRTNLTTSPAKTPEDSIWKESTSLASPQQPWRQPFVLMLDGILDPGNMGNIMRTAYFYGVDAVAVAVNTCAPLSSAVLHKAASGATEALNILAIRKPADFVAASARNGWRVHAAVAPETGKKTRKTRAQFSTNQMISPLARVPCMLMMGAEGEGLRLNLRNKASHHVTISGQYRDDAEDLGVDSLNVGAATAVLIESFMRPPPEPRAARSQKNDEVDGETVVEDVEEEDESPSVPGETAQEKKADPERLF